MIGVSLLLLQRMVMLITWASQWAKLIFQCFQNTLPSNCPFHLMQYLCLTSLSLLTFPSTLLHPLDVKTSVFTKPVLMTELRYHTSTSIKISNPSCLPMFLTVFSHNTPILNQPACLSNFTRPHLTPCLLPSFPLTIQHILPTTPFSSPSTSRYLD